MLKELEQVKKLSNTVQNIIESMSCCLAEAVGEKLPSETRIEYKYHKRNFNGTVLNDEIRIGLDSRSMPVCWIKVRCDKTKQLHIIRIDNITKIVSIHDNFNPQQNVPTRKI
mgnify:CR=1 FL=1